MIRSTIGSTIGSNDQLTFAEYDDTDGGAYDRHQTRRETVQKDGQRRVDKHVAEEERAEEKVTTSANGLDDARVALLGRCPTRRDHFQLVLVQRHQPQVQPREQPGQAQ